MNHSLEWIFELMQASSRLQARQNLQLAQAVATIMDGSAWSDMQQRLLDAATSYE
jgi:hypothetical protein